MVLQAVINALHTDENGENGENNSNNDSSFDNTPPLDTSSEGSVDDPAIVVMPYIMECAIGLTEYCMEHKYALINEDEAAPISSTATSQENTNSTTSSNLPIKKSRNDEDYNDSELEGNVIERFPAHCRRVLTHNYPVLSPGKLSKNKIGIPPRSNCRSQSHKFSVYRANLFCRTLSNLGLGQFKLKNSFSNTKIYEFVKFPHNELSEDALSILDKLKISNAQWMKASQ